MKLRVGATLQNGKYQLNQILDRQGLGATYVATQTLTRQAVVIKTLEQSLQVTHRFPEIKTRFIEEACLLARAQHPSLVRVLDFFQEENLPFLVMEYVPGQTLHDRIATVGAPLLTEAEAIHYVRQVASALAVVHSHGLVHRNIRPRTIVRRQGTNLGVLVGFGLAHDLIAPDPIHSNPFKPPSKWNPTNRFAIDLYSLAATLYYLLTGQTVTAPLKLDTSWSPATQQAILHGLSRNPHEQPQTVQDWLKLLPNTTLPLMATSNGAAAKPPMTTPPLSAPIQNGRSPKPIANAAEVALPTIPAKPVGVPVQPKPAQVASIPSPQPKVAAPLVSNAPTKSRLPKFLGVTIATTAVMGLGFGLALRISAAKAPGTSILHPVQPFAEKDWKGSTTSGDASDASIESNTTKPRTTSKATPRSYSDLEVNTPPANPVPRLDVQSPDLSRPVQPQVPRSQLGRSISTPIKPVAPVEPSSTASDAIVKPSPTVVAPTVPPAVAPEPPQPSSRSVAPTVPVNPGAGQ